jgi:hypothetical protein
LELTKPRSAAAAFTAPAVRLRSSTLALRL